MILSSLPTDVEQPFTRTIFNKVKKHTNLRGRVSSVEDTRENISKLDDVVKKSEDILLKVTSVFPFDFFPDDIIVDKNKVSIIHRIFFSTQLIRSIPIEGIGDVIVQSGPLFASLTMINMRFIHEPMTVQYLRKHDAIRVQQVVQGLVLAQQQQVDFTGVQEDTLLNKAETSGTVPVQKKEGR